MSYGGKRSVVTMERRERNLWGRMMNDEYLTEMLDPDLRFRMDSDQLSKCAQVNVVVGLNICIVNCETLVG